jgi:hypothetical protein
MPPFKIDDLAPRQPTELTPEQMNNLLGGTSELAKDPPPDGFCGTTTPTSPLMLLPDLGPLPQFDPTEFPWGVEVPSGPAGPCGPSQLTAL